MLASFTPVVRQWIPVWPMNKRFVSSILRIRLGPLIIGDLSLRREIEGNYFLSTIPLFHYWLFSSIHLNNFSFENFQRRLNEDSSWTQFLQDGENGKIGSHFHLDWFFFSRELIYREKMWRGSFFHGWWKGWRKNENRVFFNKRSAAESRIPCDLRCMARVQKYGIERKTILLFKWIRPLNYSELAFFPKLGRRGGIGK